MPLTSSLKAGLVVPIPTLPPARTVILVEELVIIFKSLFDKVPNVPVADSELPVVSHGIPPKSEVVADQEGILLLMVNIEPALPVAMVARVDVDEEPITK